MHDPPRPISRWKLLAIFLVLFTPLFLLCTLTATLVSFILPESFVGIARIRIEPPTTGSPSAQGGFNPYFIQTEFEVIQSEAVLNQVIQDLNLNEVWGKRYGTGEKLRTIESLGVLKGGLELKPVVNTSLVDIRVYSGDRNEAATLANKIAEAYIAHAKEKSATSAELIDSAHPVSRPVRPNKPLNIILGVIVGVLSGTLVGGIGIAIAHARDWKKRLWVSYTKTPA